MNRTPFPLLRIAFPLLLLVSLACQDQPVEAPNPRFHEGVDQGGSHFWYGTLSWAPTGSPGEVRFSLRAAFRRDAYTNAFGRCVGGCNGADGAAVTGDIISESQGPTRFNFGDGNVTADVLQFLVTAHSVSENWVLGEALNPATTDVGIRHTYSGTGPFTAKLVSSGANDACCRIGQTGFGTTPGLNN